MTLGHLPVLTYQEESELVEGIIDGDREAFEMFYRLYAGPLTGFARNWLSLEDAEEVVDDVLLEAAAYIEDYDPQKAGRAGLALWLLVRCRSRAIDRRRRGQRRGVPTSLDRTPLSEDGAPVIDIAAPDDPQREVEARSELRAFWASLSEQEREVVGLHHFYGLPYHEVAERLGVQVSTVHEYAKRARAKLRQRAPAGRT
jgi:RNA polymerase sigma-70 factor, ECF subfamily